MQQKKILELVIKNQKGIAYVEMLPLLVIFVMLFGLSFGLWTSIHSGTLRSIAARHYAFEVLNNRTHYIYHRDITKANSSIQYYQKNGLRFFANVDHQPSGVEPEIYYDKKDLSLFGEGVLKTDPIDSKNPKQSNPIKIKTGYGICIDFNCNK